MSKIVIDKLGQNIVRLPIEYMRILQIRRFDELDLIINSTKQIFDAYQNPFGQNYLNLFVTRNHEKKIEENPIRKSAYVSISDNIMYQLGLKVGDEILFSLLSGSVGTNIVIHLTQKNPPPTQEPLAKPISIPLITSRTQDSVILPETPIKNRFDDEPEIISPIVNRKPIESPIINSQSINVPTTSMFIASETADSDDVIEPTMSTELIPSQISPDLIVKDDPQKTVDNAYNKYGLDRSKSMFVPSRPEITILPKHQRTKKVWITDSNKVRRQVEVLA